MANHDEQIEFINNVDQPYINLWMKMIWTELLLMMRIMMVIMFLLVIKKWMKQKNLTSRSRFLGSFVLSYSRLMLDNIINASHGEDRFNNNIIKNKYIMETLIAYYVILI